MPRGKQEILDLRSTHALRKLWRHRVPGEQLFVAVVCDNCQRTAQAPTTAQLAAQLDGWYVDDQIGREIDYCPECSARLM